jgi:hypothetical protein
VAKGHCDEVRQCQAKPQPAEASRVLKRSLSHTVTPRPVLCACVVALVGSAACAGELAVARRMIAKRDKEARGA